MMILSGRQWTEDSFVVEESTGAAYKIKHLSSSQCEVLPHMPLLVGPKGKSEQAYSVGSQEKKETAHPADKH